MEKILTFLAAICLSVPVAAQQPVQWRYSFNSDGVATATYPGVVVTNGDILATQIDINADAYRQPPNYSGARTDSDIVVVQGTNAVPSTTAGAVAFFEKTSNAVAFDALAGVAFKRSNAVNARASAVYGEAIDNIGGLTTFVEGGRYQGTLITGSVNGSAYGTICAAAAATGSVTPQYLVGCEGQTINQIGPNAPAFTSFDRDKFSAGFVATNGCAGCGAFQADAGFVVNPYSESPFRTGFLITQSSVNHTGIAFGIGSSMQTGIDLGPGAFSYAAIITPNNTPIRMKNAASSLDLNVLTLDTSNVLNVGLEAVRITFGQIAQLRAFTVATLPTCNATNIDALAVVTDAAAPTYNANVTGGGAIRIPVFCNGANWTAH